MAKSEQQTKFDSQNPIIYDNTTREVISVMPDTLDNKLRDFEEGVKNRGSIFHDLGLIIAFLGTLVTVSEFRDFMGLHGNVWQALFILFLILSVVKLCRDVFFNYHKTVKRSDILKQLLDEAKRKK
ncbi:MAG: hypothetical protein A2667_01985 [Candidatus Wildermuthbacteria bacterium RIFCSPHIGHO2_01_FULL_47_27]|uniref:Uncharacterized protein n=1 Tax=Candidatus Wildermuthbacteria bacterium RIFCSPHIGHO2_02_FULL_47_17 TaxID=1802452 RepID=A0A1G2R2X8_9BACT|nr:MAG: hypothetical protein A2667_01985 [Candidatus Wildermuthbacteria bacterium RIFCSPHIGHO2_01_FULL_47_27]OHA67186.1 MAG: hypothetical protein A3D59_02335 [Candidatus Wildermuthbacteria bacterium RIFCSPHIGHO2_02_FULL_47_17]